MHEYIKKLAASLCLLSNHLKEDEYKVEIKKVSMSLISFNNSISIGHENFQFQNLRNCLIHVIDLLDILKISNSISSMNADIILQATVKIVEELDKDILHKSSFLLPKFSLTEMSQNILRDRAKNNLQESHLKYSNNLNNEIFNFTKVPVLSFGVSGEQQVHINSLEKEMSGVLKNNSIQNDKEDSLNKFDWANGNSQNSNSKPNKQIKGVGKDEQKIDKLDKDELKENANKVEPIVYTVFGEMEENLINERRTQILAILKNGGGSIASISKLMPGLNSKTLQRDLIELMRERKVIMLGKKRWSKYYLR